MRLFLSLLREMRYWDRTSKFALALALVLLSVSLFILSTQPELRNLALVSSVGLVIAVQVVVLWGNRTMVTPYTQAQRHFLEGEFEQAQQVLEAYSHERQNEGKGLSVNELVLLGNTYRNLGLLESSAGILHEALERKPDSPFALYGIGKTQLAQGEYTTAVQSIQQAIDEGAPQIVRFDLAHAHFRQLDYSQALQTMPAVADLQEPYRQLFAAYLQYRLADDPAPATELIHAGLPFWEAEVERFANTSYGQAVQEDVDAIRALL